MGSATLTAIRINKDNIESLNIGDAGYSFWRYSPASEFPISRSDHENRLQLVYQSAVGLKRFNYPHQVGYKGDDIFKFGDVTTHKIQDKDIYVLFSDGVSDNLSIEKEVFKKCLASYLDQNGVFSSMSAAADCIAVKANQLSKDKTFLSPFGEGAKEAGIDYLGGKQDDISVTVAQVFVNRVNEDKRTIQDFHIN